VIRVGVDLGATASVITALEDGRVRDLPLPVVRSVVGFPKPGILPGIIPGEAEALFGDEAIEYRLHLDLEWPFRESPVPDLAARALFARHLRSRLDPGGGARLWGVVGSPAGARSEDEDAIRAAMDGVLERLRLVPEPFLAAAGLMEDPAYHRAGGMGDPTRHSLVIDIGTEATLLTLVRGSFPTAGDGIRLPQAGDAIDDLIIQGAARRFPELELARGAAARIKERCSFVSGYEREATERVLIDGRQRVIDFSEIVQEACDAIVPPIIKGIKDLLARCDSDTLIGVMQCLIVTGGGSLIHGLCPRIQEILNEEGYDCARTVRPSDPRRLVAAGALKIGL
jgi:rod shape-determining protein MreB